MAYQVQPNGSRRKLQKRTCEICSQHFWVRPDYKQTCCGAMCGGQKAARQRESSIKAGELFIYWSNGTRTRALEKICPTCHESFITRLSTPKTYCSKKCGGIARRDREGFTCPICGTFKEVRRSIYARAAGKRFCSKRCASLGHRAEHEGRATASKRSTVMRIANQSMCESCPENRVFLLEIHHIDGNHTNNPIDGSNWEILCPTCHALRHLELVDGSWTYRAAALTPRNLLSQLYPGRRFEKSPLEWAA